eukprot:RCo011980
MPPASAALSAAILRPFHFRSSSFFWGFAASKGAFSCDLYYHVRVRLPFLVFLARLFRCVANSSRKSAPPGLIFVFEFLGRVWWDRLGLCERTSCAGLGLNQSHTYLDIIGLLVNALRPCYCFVVRFACPGTCSDSDALSPSSSRCISAPSFWWFCVQLRKRAHALVLPGTTCAVVRTPVHVVLHAIKKK